VKIIVELAGSWHRGVSYTWAPKRFKKWYGSGWKTSAAGARIEAPKAPRVWGVGGVSLSTAD